MTCRYRVDRVASSSLQCCSPARDVQSNYLILWLLPSPLPPRPPAPAPAPTPAAPPPPASPAPAPPAPAHPAPPPPAPCSAPSLLSCRTSPCRKCRLPPCQPDSPGRWCGAPPTWRSQVKADEATWSIDDRLEMVRHRPRPRHIPTPRRSTRPPAWSVPVDVLMSINITAGSHFSRGESSPAGRPGG